MMIPSGFTVTGNVSTKERYASIIAEIERNEKAKAVFQKTTGLGALELDTCNKMFHIDNAYFMIKDLTEYSFYAGEPRYQYGLFGNYEVFTDVYFAYRIRKRSRCIRKLKTVPVHFEQTDTRLCIDPPMAMLAINATFKQLVDEIREDHEEEIFIAEDDGANRVFVRKPPKRR